MMVFGPRTGTVPSPTPYAHNVRRSATGVESQFRGHPTFVTIDVSDALRAGQTLKSAETVSTFHARMTDQENKEHQI
jgi:hypothetical protein